MSLGTPLRPGDPVSVAGYRLIKRLGSGGQGTVFLGQAVDGARVAVKLLHARLDATPDARMRFAREIDAARQVEKQGRSFCTARILAADVEGDTPYLVSEFIEGPALSQAVRERGTLTGDDLYRLAVGTATALVAIHAAGVVHRDFKPANILMGDQGPRVVDFGIARAMDATSTLTSQVIGTPAYMAPEQVAGDPVSPATDIFAWAAAMHFAATGRPPFGQDNVPAVFQRVLNHDPDPSGLPEPLRTIVTSCLAKNPADRPTAEQLLHHLLHDPISDPQPTAGRTVSWQQRRSRAWLFFFVYGVVMFVGTIYNLFIEGPGDSVIPGLGTALFFLLASGLSGYPLNAKEAQVKVDNDGITLTLDDRVKKCGWDGIKHVSIRPWGVVPFRWSWGLWAQGQGIRWYGNTFRWPLFQNGRWTLLLPLGHSDDPHIQEIADALSHYGHDRWTPTPKRTRLAKICGIPASAAWTRNAEHQLTDHPDGQ